VNLDLDALVSADEQARARVREARETACAEVARVREKLVGEREQRIRELETALEADIARIRAEASERVDQRRRQRAERRERRRLAAEALLPAARDAFVGLLRGQPVDEGRT
jgi:Spy/CpxP family protein refolding chaperone